VFQRYPSLPRLAIALLLAVMVELALGLAFIQTRRVSEEFETEG
jgi:hypothetical protein